jgi:hypothetical protein
MCRSYRSWLCPDRGLIHAQKKWPGGAVEQEQERRLLYEAKVLIIVAPLNQIDFGKARTPTNCLTLRWRWGITFRSLYQRFLVVCRPRLTPLAAAQIARHRVH